MSYRVELRPSALRDLKKLPPGVRERISERIDALGDNPRGPGTKSLKGNLKGLWRLRVGDYRVMFVVDDRKRTVDVLRVGARGSLYRR